MDISIFRIWLILGTFFSAMLLPTYLYVIWLRQWGSNLVWGSLYGLGWCVPDLLFDLSIGTQGLIGVIWSFGFTLILYAGSGWLWERLSDRGRRNIWLILIATLLIDLPGSVMMALGSYVHLPDLATHIAMAF